jgi:hypothetical protein
LASVDSPTSSRNDGNDLVFEKDGLVFTYNLNRTKKPIQVRIENKGNQLVSIDWKKSALIVNAQSVSLVPSYIAATGSVSSETNRRSVNNEKQINMNLAVPQDVVYIHPHSFIDQLLPDAFMLPIDNVPDSAFSDKIMQGLTNADRVGKEAFFSGENSPLHFRCYLFMKVEDTTERTMIIDHDFYVSGITELTVGGAPSMQTDQNGDRFLVVKPATQQASANARRITKSSIRK